MEILLVVFVVLWLAGFVHIPNVSFHDTTLFTFGGISISLFDICIFLAILWAIEKLPTPLRQIIIVLAIAWLLSLLGVISLAGASTYIIWAVIIAAVVAMIKK
jgi:hypothetical protein